MWRQFRSNLLAKLATSEVVSQEAKVVVLGGTTNLNLLVSDPTPYVIRVYQPWAVQQRITGLRVLRQRLEQSGLQVPKPIRIVDRDVFKLFGYWAEAESYLPHSPAQIGQYPQLFSALGVLHRAMLDCWEYTTPEPTFPNYGTIVQLNAWLQGSTQHMKVIADRQRIVERVAKAIQTLSNLEQEYISSLPQVPVHGDYTHSNIGFTTGGEPVFLDFDVASVKPRVHDLAYAALTMLRRLQHSVEITAPSWEMILHMVDEYERTAQKPLSRLERSAFPVEMARVTLCLAARAGFPSAHERSWSVLTRSLVETEHILEMIV